MNITITGIGYVGLANAILLAQHNKVIAVDVVQEKVDQLNRGISPLSDPEIENYLATKKLNLTATTESNSAYQDAQFVIIATPTNYDTANNHFDTSSIERVIEQVLEVNANVTIVIKSTVPMGYTTSIRKKYPTANILFSPEFLREGRALYDNLHPSRIVVGVPMDNPYMVEQAKIFADLLTTSALKEDIPTLFMNSAEAEAIKLFSNTYLAMRVAYFNEIDTYTEIEGLNAMQIIEGMGLDPRIGAHYNNPSFGYGGYCLPKDTKQLLANYQHVPNNMIEAIVKANDTRKNFIAQQILNKKPKTVGIYRLTMKNNSDNFRQSSIQDVITILQKNNIEIIIYEPMYENTTFNDIKITKDLDAFKSYADVIVANRYDKELEDVYSKVYTRDIYFKD